MADYNLDIFPKDATIKQFPNIRSLIVNESIQSAFRVREQQAASAKRQYHFLGRIGIGLIAFAAIYSAAEGLMFASYSPPHVLAQVAAASAVIGVALQIYLLASRRKHHWLVNRFAAERLRSIKFQAFLIACGARDAAEIEATANAFCVNATRALDAEVAAANFSLARFSPSRALRLGNDVQPFQDATLAAEIRGAYVQLRTNFQKQFAASENRLIEERSRSTRSASDLIYLAGASLVGAALLLKLGWLDMPAVEPSVDFAAFALFVIGLSLAVLENASIDEDSRSRYDVYGQDLTDLMANEGTRIEQFGGLVRQTELLALRELADFCRAAERITYRV